MVGGWGDFVLEVTCLSAKLIRIFATFDYFMLG